MSCSPGLRVDSSRSTKSFRPSIETAQINRRKKCVNIPHSKKDAHKHKYKCGLSVRQCTISVVSCWDWLNRPRFAPIVLISRFQHDYELLPVTINVYEVARNTRSARSSPSVFSNVHAVRYLYFLKFSLLDTCIFLSPRCSTSVFSKLKFSLLAICIF